MLPEDLALFSRAEDAGINATAPPQQRWVDGWLLRFSPGAAKRARCINAVATGRSSFEERLALAQAIYTQANLPLIFRITPFSQPGSLDDHLAALGFVREPQGTCVMVCRALASKRVHALPRGYSLHRVGAHVFAQAVGQLRGSPLAQRQAHAQRMELSPVPFDAYVIKSDADGAVAACAQGAVEGQLVGLYDVITNPEHRSKGLAASLCEHILMKSKQDATVQSGYLQVEAHNHAARRIYTRLGFADAFQYHYRWLPNVG